MPSVSDFGKLVSACFRGSKLLESGSVAFPISRVEEVRAVPAETFPLPAPPRADDASTAAEARDEDRAKATPPSGTAAPLDAAQTLAAVGSTALRVFEGAELRELLAHISRTRQRPLDAADGRRLRAAGAGTVRRATRAAEASAAAVAGAARRATRAECAPRCTCAECWARKDAAWQRNETVFSDFGKPPKPREVPPEDWLLPSRGRRSWLPGRRPNTTPEPLGGALGGALRGVPSKVDGGGNGEGDGGA
jgi:hypothetical protein